MILSIDWTEFAGHLETWAQLRPEARYAVAHHTSSQPIAAEALTEAEQRLMIDRGLLRRQTTKPQLVVPETGREFARAIRFMARHSELAEDRPKSIEAYVDELLVREDRLALLGTHRGSYPFHQFAYQTVMSVAWVRELLKQRDTKSARGWESSHRPGDTPTQRRHPDHGPYFGDADLLSMTRRLLTCALEWKQPIALADLPGHVPHDDASLLWRAVEPAVRYLMLFVRLDEAQMPIISLWPGIVAVRHRPAPVLPGTMTPTQTFHLPMIVEDVTSCLVAAAGEPIRLRKTEYGMYQRDANRIAEALIAMPDWFETEVRRETTTAYQEADPVSDRIDKAMDYAVRNGLLKAPSKRDTYLLAPSSAGEQWLSEPIDRRIRQTLDPWREDAIKQRKQASSRSSRHGQTHLYLSSYSHQQDSRWSPVGMRHARGPEPDWVGFWTDILTGDADPSDASPPFRILNEFCQYHARVNNPLTGARLSGESAPAPKVEGDYQLPHPSMVDLERIWSRTLYLTILMPMMQLGAVELATDDQRIGFRLHPMGRYLLGLADRFDAPTEPEGQIIIQPNFEVVFLGPSPRAEATLSRLAERTGRGMGAIFRITKQSIFDAADTGITCDGALADLDRLLAKPLPTNVRREITGWFGQITRAQLRSIVVIDAPDEQTAHRILAAAGAKARALTPTLVEIQAKKADRTNILRKLKKAGVFIE